LEQIKTTLCGKNEDMANAKAGGANTIELLLSGFNGTKSHPNVQKIVIIGPLFENRLHWQFEVEKFFYICFTRIHVYLRTNKTLIHHSLFVSDNLGKNLSHNKMQYNYSKASTRRAKPVWIIGDPDNQRPDKWSSTVVNISILHYSAFSQCVREIVMVMQIYE
jgi:hypothetical protein